MHIPIAIPLNKGTGNQPLALPLTIPPIGTMGQPNMAVPPVSSHGTRTVTDDYETKIRSYIVPTDDKSFVGSPAMANAIAMLVFTSKRDSNTSVLESGGRVVLRRDFIQDYVHSILEKAKLRYGVSLPYVQLVETKETVSV